MIYYYGRPLWEGGDRALAPSWEKILRIC